MTAIATPTPRTLSNVKTALKQLNASTKVYAGAYLSLSSGKVVALAAAFAGIALETRDPADGYTTMPVAIEGLLHQVSVTGASSASDIGSTVYASDSGTLTKTSTSNYALGKIEDFDPVTSKFTVSFKSANLA